MKEAYLKFAVMTPLSKEEYYYRTIFEQHFPSVAAISTVSQNKYIASYSEKAVEWDELFNKKLIR